MGGQQDRHYAAVKIQGRIGNTYDQNHRAKTLNTNHRQKRSRGLGSPRLTAAVSNDGFGEGLLYLGGGDEKVKSPKKGHLQW